MKATLLYFNHDNNQIDLVSTNIEPDMTADELNLTAEMAQEAIAPDRDLGFIDALVDDGRGWVTWYARKEEEDDGQD